MKLIGKIFDIKKSQQVSDTFKKRLFVLEYAENLQYPEYISFELIQDRCSLIDGFQVGQEVEVSFNLKGRKWMSPEGETKYFNTLQAWRIEEADQASNQPAQEGVFTQNTPAPTAEEDDLPF